MGAALWVSILAWIGYFIGKKEELIAEYAHEAVIGVVIFSAILASVYTVLHRRKLRRQQDLAAPGSHGCILAQPRPRRRPLCAYHGAR